VVDEIMDFISQCSFTLLGIWKIVDHIWLIRKSIKKAI